MHEMPVGWIPILSAVLAHCRKLYPVLETQRADSERLKNRYHRIVDIDIRKTRNRACVFGKPTVHRRDIGCVAKTQIFVGNALGTAQHVKRKLFGALDRSVTVDMLEPAQADHGCPLQFIGFDLARFLVRFERLSHVAIGTRNTVGQRNRIFHRKLGARADAEMR